MTSLFSLDPFPIFGLFIHSLTCFMLFVFPLRWFFHHWFVSSENSVKFQCKIGTTARISPFLLEQLFFFISNFQSEFIKHLNGPIKADITVRK